MMKAFTISTCFIFIEILVANEFAAYFIEVVNKTFAIIAIDNEEFQFDKFLLKDFLNFQIKSETLEKCDENFFEAPNETSKFQWEKLRQSKSFKDFKEIQSELNSNFIILTPSHFLRSSLKCFTNSDGTLYAFITDNKTGFTDQELMNLLNDTWTNNGALNVFISIYTNVYSFDPFHLNHNGMYGKLNSSSDPSRSMKLKNLNKRRINIEIFPSIFTNSSVKNAKNVDDFFGPDAEAAKTIRDRLNATSLWNYLLLNFWNVRNIFSLQCRWCLTTANNLALKILTELLPER